MLDVVAESAARLCDAWESVIWQVEGNAIRLTAGSGSLTTFVMTNTVPITRTRPVGRAILDRRTIHVEDLVAGVVTDFPETRRLTERGVRTLLVAPLLRNAQAVGGIVVSRTEMRPFTDRQIKLLEAFADQAVIAIENARLFQELQERTAQLTRSVGELEALGEVSQAVSSTLDLQDVLTTVVAHAVRLSGADGGTIYELDETTGDFILRASHLMPEDLLAAVQHTKARLTDDSIIGRAARSGRPEQMSDIGVGQGIAVPTTLDALRRAGFRALLVVPLVREGRALGALVIRRKTPGEFPQAVVDLVQTFASQSVLAIENARLFQRVQETSRQLEVASQHKSQFLANMSHELRTPLNAIIGYSEMLQEEAEDTGEEAFLPDLQRINSAGKHLLALINDILDLSKIEAGRMNLDLETFEISRMVQDVAAIVQPLVDKNGNSLIVTCPDDLGTMQADQTKVRQTLFNLLSNAAKFTDHGTITLRVARDGRTVPDTVRTGEETSADRLGADVDGVGAEDTGRLEVGPDRVDTWGDAGRLGLGPDRIDAWEPAPTSPPAVGAGSQQTVPAGPNPNLPASSVPIRSTANPDVPRDPQHPTPNRSATEISATPTSQIPS